MNKLVNKILKESGIKARVNNDSKSPKFRIKDGQLTLEGIVTDSTYSMTIKDTKGAIIDKLTVSVNDGNDVANRIHESISTLNKLSPIYDEHIRITEEEEFEELPEATPGDIDGALTALNGVYDSLMDIADQLNDITEYYEEDDAEGKNQMTAFISSVYDVAIDIDDYIDDTVEDLESAKAEDEYPTESLKSKKTKKNNVRNALNSMTVAEAMLRGNKEYTDVYKAVKNIVAEMKLRSIK